MRDWKKQVHELKTAKLAQIFLLEMESRNFLSGVLMGNFSVWVLLFWFLKHYISAETWLYSSHSWFKTSCAIFSLKMQKSTGEHLSPLLPFLNHPCFIYEITRLCLPEAFLKAQSGGSRFFCVCVEAHWKESSVTWRQHIEEKMA